MSLEEKLIGWTGPSSSTEQEKQDRTERMIRQAINSHEPFNNCSLNIYAKGSYANNTNVRSDSDVDIAVECTDVLYWEESETGIYTPGTAYKGIWTPAKFRSELISAMRATFPGQIDTSGSTAIQINSGSARVDADVVPCFSFQYHMINETRDGTKIFKTDGSSIVNYPAQQMTNGIAKNNRTGYAYKKGARILKRIENAMAEDGYFSELPSFFMECLAYNCPDTAFAHSRWTECIKDMLVYIWTNLQGDEPKTARWVEVNECFYLFHSDQKWTRKDGREFSKAAWNYLGIK
ncbi:MULTISPECIES: nucleotidyltransferase domain-containing protein [Pseudomonas]|uniref:nucleotidyltransferase domain-containing protein n=1 Tax=Pseudomonas TaxID=286 RepID=UPI000985857D|nr:MULTISPECIES: nucleotidyltransferase [Pseudomonas]OOG10150.1 nucleotidyltransferase [Pseudomonas sp. C9]UVM72929.1 nucleotidyltransferase [Pseudomonas canavaninivorans]